MLRSFSRGLDLGRYPNEGDGAGESEAEGYGDTFVPGSDGIEKKMNLV